MNENEPDNQKDQPTDETTELPPEPATAPTEEQHQGESRRSRRLLRSRSDRMVFGVAGGLGRYFDVDPVIFRIAFGVSVFFGGLGVLAYIALALFVPSDDDGSQAPVQRSKAFLAAGIVLVAIALGWGLSGLFFWDGGWHGHPWGALWLLIPIGIGAAVYAVLRDRGKPLTLGRVFGAIVLVFAAATGLFIVALAGALLTAVGHGVAIAATVAVAGLAIAVAALAGGGVRWLIAPALALAVGVGGAAAADLPFDSSFGQRSYRPVSVSSIPADGYKLGIGQLKVDLRGLDWHRKQVVDLDADLGIGQLVVGVPENVCVEATTHAGAGELDVTGQRSDGVDVDANVASGSTATPRLVLDADVDMGQIQVINSNTADLDEQRHGFFHEDTSALRDAAERACAS
jgi:phage shock protein PspC (stress-responsive transcriptional regulator)